MLHVLPGPPFENLSRLGRRKSPLFSPPYIFSSCSIRHGISLSCFSSIIPLLFSSNPFSFSHLMKSVCNFKMNMNSSLFSTISLATVLSLILLASSIFSNLSLHSVAFESKKHPPGFPPRNTHKQFRSSSSPKLLLSLKEEIQEPYVRDPDPLLPPINVTVEERIVWFKENLPEFKIIHSNGLTRKFASRAHEFFNGGCEVRFFMTWISPVRAFGYRELLTLESVFKAHPFGCVMILSASMDSRQGSQLLKPLVDSGYRVAAVSPGLSFLFKDTPAESWFNELKKGNVDPGEIPLAQNLSNLLRLAVLYKYGGVYLDTDVIVLKKFSALRNTIGAQAVDENGNWNRLNNAVLVFDKEHPLIYKFIQEFALTFDGNKWGHNGPYLVSRVVSRIEKRPNYNFTVLPPLAFYPVDWIRISGFFRRPENTVESKWAAAKLRQLSGETFAIHLWNRQSSSMKIEEGSVVGRLISYRCLFCKQSYSS